jgi:hypothetical protein
MTVTAVRSITVTAPPALRTTAPFTMSEWFITHSGGAGQVDAVGLYIGVLSGAAVAGVGAGIGIFLVWRSRRKVAGVNPRGLVQETAEDGYVAGQWGAAPETNVSVVSIAMIHGDDIDELL